MMWTISSQSKLKITNKWRNKIQPNLRWLYIVFFGTRSMGTNGASARVFKRKEKTRVNMAARLLSLSFLSRTSVHQKTPRNVFNITLLSSKKPIRSTYRADIGERRRSWSYAKEVTEWLEASLWVPWAMKHRKQLECLQRRNWHRKHNHHCLTRRVGSHERNPLKVETRTTGLVG